MVPILIGLTGAALGIWLLPAWVLPWAIGAGLLFWAYFCVVQAGYPVIPTYAWAIPVAMAMVVGASGHSRGTQIIGFLALIAWLTLYAYEPARRFWYVKLFRWRFDRSD
ncbi:MAG TPA: hypothetical protein VI733_03990 [Candidatus Limnocylindria bacterium]|nr:hypothetical protein [Candidatus Limnocylindria bacterium]